MTPPPPPSRRDAEAELNLPPGFRFHPTDEELVVHYLCRRAAHQNLPVPIIAEVDLYKFDPWQLPEMALFGSKEWYFFTPRDRKYPNGSRPNRAAGSGYWKATGADKPVAPAGRSRAVGIKKALVFYAGKAPRGVKTNWIMHEYRLADADRSAGRKGSGLRLDDWVLCRLYNKKNNWKKDVAAVAAPVQPQASDDVSLGDTTDSFEAVEELAWDGRRSPLSDVDNDVLSTPEAPSINRVRDDDEQWFMDLKLEDLSGSFDPAGFLSYHDGSFPSFGFGSPLMMNKSSSQINLMAMPF